MAFEQRDNSGALFKNDRREKPEHPEYQGTIRVDGKDYWISAWVKGGQDGKKKFFSLAVTAKDKQFRPGKQNQAQDDDDLDDIPF